MSASVDDSAGKGRHGEPGPPGSPPIPPRPRGTAHRDDGRDHGGRIGRLPEGGAVSWTFEAHPGAVRQARRDVRATLSDWGLDPLADTTVLLVSELVTNSLRYARGPIGVRMVRGGSLLVEVSDPLPDPPRRRTAHEEDEGGRGLQLVAGASRRWGTRHGPLGKTVWFELTIG